MIGMKNVFKQMEERGLKTEKQHYETIGALINVLKSLPENKMKKKVKGAIRINKVFMSDKSEYQFTNKDFKSMDFEDINNVFTIWESEIKETLNE